MSTDHEKFMTLAIEEARKGLRAGEQPFGSIIVREGEIVGRVYNVVNSSGDPTAHAEVMAVRAAAANLKSPSLKDCTLYTSCDPCPMCAGAMLFSNIDRVIIGARSEALARISGRPPRTYTAEALSEMMNMKLEVIRGVLQDEAEKVLAGISQMTTLSHPAVLLCHQSTPFYYRFRVSLQNPLLNRGATAVLKPQSLENPALPAHSGEFGTD